MVLYCKNGSHREHSFMFMVVAIETLQATGGLRMVHVPENLAQQFLTAASSNTRRNVETGGFLAGKLVNI